MAFRGTTRDCLYQCKGKQHRQSVGVFILIWESSLHDMSWIQDELCENLSEEVSEYQVISAENARQKET